MAKKTLHQRIMLAAKVRRGLRLTADEVFDLSQDDAIRACALNDDEEDAELKLMRGGDSNYG